MATHLFSTLFLFSVSHSNLAPPTWWGGSDMWRLSLILFLNHHCCRRLLHLHPTKKDAGQRGFTHFKFCCWLSGGGGVTPSDVVLLNYILQQQRQLKRQVLDLTHTSQHTQCMRLVKVCVLVCVCLCWEGEHKGGGGFHQLSFDFQTFFQINMLDCYLNHWNSQWGAIFSYMNHVEGESFTFSPLPPVPNTEAPGLSTVLRNLAWC